MASNPRIEDVKIAGYGNRITADEWTVVRNGEGQKVGPEPRDSSLANAKQIQVMVTDSHGSTYFATITVMRGFGPDPWSNIWNQIIDMTDGGSEPLAGLTIAAT